MYNSIQTEQSKKASNDFTYDCKFVTYIEPQDYSLPDLHIVKRDKVIKKGNETIIEPELKMVYDFKRPFYITKKGKQNHTQHKEWEDVDNLIKYESTQSKLLKRIASALHRPLPRDHRELFKNPYIYGADIKSTSMIKKMYQDKYPDTKVRHTLGICDIETDMLDEDEDGKKEIIMCSLTYFGKCHHCVLKRVADKVSDYKKQFYEGIFEYLEPQVLTKRNITRDNIKQKISVDICETPADIVINIFKKANEWMFDFLVFWNMDFDITRMIQAIEDAGLEMKDIISHPDVPKEYRTFNYKRGKEKKITTSGKITPIRPEARWHVVTASSSFYVVDAMCIYKQVRTGKQEEQNYGLDDILNKVLGKRKLNFSFADHLKKPEWHIFMQSNYVVPYGVYNLFDCLGIEELDERTNDVCLTFPMFARFSDFSLFPSQPKRIAERLYYFILNKNKIVGSPPVSSENEDEEDLDELTTSLKGWIITLEAGLLIENDIQVLNDYSGLETSIFICSADLDVSASYPNNGSTMNISKETTKKELISIEGIDEVTHRAQTTNLISSGHVNAVEFCTTMYGFPQLHEWSLLFQQRKK